MSNEVGRYDINRLSIVKGQYQIPIPHGVLQDLGEVTIRKVGNLLVVEKAVRRIKSEVTFRVINPKTKEVVSQTTINTICDLGHAHIADQMAERSEEQMGWIAVGDTSGGKTSASTTLENELVRRPCTLQRLTGADDDKVQYYVVFEAGTLNTTVVEAAIFNHQTLGTMMAYTEFSQAVTSAQDFDITWKVTY